MRPKLLKMTAFGPYAQEQIIDFTQLEDANMFLIYGPTGGGKTTILDAICYALYGETNGGERSGENMRSKFAKEGVVTEVALYFQLRQEQYYIVRRPQYERAPKKGKSDRLIKVPSEVELYKKEGDEYKIITSKSNEVSEKITELLHFNIGQFRQVIMIAQNKFRELLTVSSKERQQILQDIFETATYQNVEKTLDVLASQAREKLHDREIAYEGLLNHIVPIDNEQLEHYIDTKIIYNAPQVCTILEETCKAKREEAQKLSNTLEVLSQEINMSQEILGKLKGQYEEIQNKKLAEERLKTLEAKTEEYEALKVRIDRGEKVNTIQPIEQVVMALKTQVLQSQKQKEVDEKILEETLSQLEEKQAYLKISEKLVGEVEQLKKEYSILETYMPKVADLSKTYELINKLKADLAKGEETYYEILLKIDKLKEVMSKAEEALKEKESIQKTLTNHYIVQKEMEAVLKLHDEKTQKEKEASETFAYLKVLYEKLNTASKKHQISEKQYKVAFATWFNNQAAELAKGLEEHMPCPVCGSLHHPQKAVITEAHITKEQLEVLENETKHLESIVNSLKQDCTAQEEQCKLLKGILEQYQEKLQGKEHITLETKQILEQEIKMLEEKQVHLEKVAKSLEENKEELKNQEIRKEKGSQYISDKKLAFSQQIAYIEAIEADVPKDLRHIEALKDRLDTVKHSYEIKEKQYKALVEEVDKLTQLLTKQKAALEADEKNLENLKSQGTSQKKILEEALYKAGFIDLKDYTTSKMTEVELKTAKQSVEAYINEKLVLINKCKELTAKTKDFTMTALEEAKKKYETVFNENTNLSVTKTKIDQYLVTHERIIIQLKELYEEVQSLLKRQKVLEKISSLAKGKNNKGLSFERYIQSSIFEEVLEYANKKLRPMTLNRYELYRAVDLSRANAQVGLDIGIYDYYSNETRPVSTLSGGESFMAALALALGLSEVIQKLAGATPLDTLFIDEGFGSLDEEALEMAIKTLLSIQDTGRLIGIISHVRELREQIPIRLEVTTGPTGSKAAFRI